MLIDRTTETIAHFVGLFQLSVEKMIQREQYQEFRAAMNARDDLEAINAVPFQIDSGFRLKDYDPKLKYKAPSDAMPNATPPIAAELTLPPWSVFNNPFGSPPDSNPPEGATAAQAVSFSFTLPLPSSLVAVNVQLASLSDNDSFGPGATEMFVPATAFDAMLEALADVAESLQGFSIPDLPESEDGWQPFAGEVIEQVAEAIAAAASAVAGATVAVASGDAAQGIMINGESADEVPDFADLLPEFHQDEDAEGDDAAADDQAASGSDDDVADGLSALEDDDVDAVISTADGDVGTQLSADNGTSTAGDSGTGQSQTTTTASQTAQSTSTGTQTTNTTTETSQTSTSQSTNTAASDDAQTTTTSEDSTTTTQTQETSEETVVASSDSDTTQEETANASSDSDSDTQEGAVVSSGETTASDEDATSAETATTTSSDTTATQTSEASQTEEPHDFDRDFEDRPDNEWAVEDGHQIVAGGNTQLNEVQSASSWLDAEVIAVAGDVIKVDAISQVNVLSGVDQVNDQIADATSTALNVAQIIQTSSEAPTESDASDEDAQTQNVDDADDTDGLAADNDPVEPEYMGLPTNAVVVRLEADVTQINWTIQDSFTTDNDVANVTVAASATYLGLGDNTVFNEVFLTESGFNYDLILIGGDLIDISMVSQTNVLLDGGTINIEGLGDVVDVSSGDNLQYNLAQLTSVGIDTEAELTENFEDALEALEDGAEDVGGDVTSDDLFEGVELLRVLYIAGDLTTINVAQQTNVLGDVDQLNVAQAAIDAAQNLEGLAQEISGDTEAQIEIITGSNAQANIAVIEEFGIDSTVMAGGDYYSDALIHQAELIDTDAIPTGVELAALANEAVAFLADDMMDTSNLANDIIANTTSIISDTAGQSDVMQTVLS